MMDETEKSTILLVGLSCLDIVSECTYFPKEDEKVGSTTIVNRLAHYGLIYFCMRFGSDNVHILSTKTDELNGSFY